MEEYFIIDPNDKNVSAYFLKDNHFHQKYRKEGLLDSNVLGKKFQF